ncbi:MAG: hypothetical protein A4E61_00241 [Syntrophorhabdus sp. PtaB.Bin184]|nr:MAG: hypothetical protein A4E61_00241 [Syntrophorhabdus sp. PtaB.Bin184]
MLKTQKQVELKGGLDPRLMTGWFIEQVRGLRIRSLWVSADHPSYEQQSIEAIGKLTRAGFTQRHIFCYVLVGWDGETMHDATARLRRIYLAGAMPFAQPYDKISDKAWRRFAKTWSRPAVTKAVMRECAISG